MRNLLLRESIIISGFGLAFLSKRINQIFMARSFLKKFEKFLKLYFPQLFVHWNAKCLYMKEFFSSFDENVQFFSISILFIVNRFENFAAHFCVDSILKNLIYKFLIIATIVKLEEME